MLLRLEDWIVSHPFKLINFDFVYSCTCMYVLDPVAMWLAGVLALLVCPIFCL